MISNKQKKVCKTLNNIEHFLVLPSAVTRCVSISAFISLLGILTGITSSAIELKICAKATRIKKFKSINEKRKKRHDKIALLAKTKLNTVESFNF